MKQHRRFWRRSWFAVGMTLAVWSVGLAARAQDAGTAASGMQEADSAPSTETKSALSGEGDANGSPATNEGAPGRSKKEVAVARDEEAVAHETTGQTSRESAAEPPPQVGAFQGRIQVDAALKVMLVEDRGFDPFARRDLFPMVGARLSYRVANWGRLSIVPSLTWAFGTMSAYARGEDARLDVHRLGLSLEGRYELLPSLYAFVRVAPGAANLAASVRPSVTELKDSPWVASLDASAGLAFLLGPRRSSRVVRWWIIGEAGYAWSDRAGLRLSGTAAQGEIGVGSLRLGSLAMSGALGSIGIASSY